MLHIEQGRLSEKIESSTVEQLYEFALKNENHTYLEGNTESDYGYQEDADYLNAFPKFDLTIKKDYYLKIKDPEVKRLFIEWLSNDGVGVTLSELSNLVGSDRNRGWYGTNGSSIKNYNYTTEVFYNNDKIEDLTYLKYLTNCTKYLHQFVNKCKNVKRVAFPPKLTKIGEDNNNPEFYGCTKLEYVDWSNITSIGGSCFNGCTLLAFNKYPDQLTNVGTNVFCNTGISVSDTNNINGYDGYGCPNITSILIKAPVTTLGNRAFKSPNLMSVKFEYADEPNITVNGGGSWGDVLFEDRYPKSYVDFKNRIKSVSQISMGFSKPKKLIFRNTVPPTAKKNNDDTFISYTFSSLFGSDKQVYVPDALLTTYRTAEGWSDYTSQIHPLSEFSADDYDEDE